MSDTPISDKAQFGHMTASRKQIQVARELETKLAKVTEERDAARKQLDKERDVPLCAGHAQTWFTARHFKPGECWFCQCGEEASQLRQRAEKAEAELAEAIIGRCTCSGCNRVVNNAWRNDDGNFCLTCLSNQLAEAREDSERMKSLLSEFVESVKQRAYSPNFEDMGGLVIAAEKAMQKGAE